VAAAGAGRQLHLGLALAKPGRSALTLKADAVAGRRHDVAQADVALELGRNRPDAQGHADVVFVVGRGLDLVATRDAQLEHLWIIQGLPGLLLRHAQ
jgi:hypothetical protein